MPLETEPLELAPPGDVPKWEDYTPVEDVPKWEDYSPVEPEQATQFSPPPGAARVQVVPPSEFPEETPRWEDYAPVEPEPQPLELRAPTPQPPKTVWENTKGFLRSIISPLIGSTQKQIDADVQALLSADSEAAKYLFDEKGALTVKGKSAWDSLMRGVDQAQGLGYGLGMLGADVVGADRLAEWMKLRMEMNQAQVEANPPEVGTAEAIGKGYPTGPAGLIPRVRRGLTYGVEAVGENIPMMVPSLVGGGGGGILAKKILTKGVEKALVEEALKAGAKKIAAAQAVGAYAGATAVEAGSIYQDMVNQGTRGPIPATVAFLGGLAAGALDAITPFLAVRRLGQEAIGSPIEHFLRSTLGEAFVAKGLVRVGIAGFEGALTEGPTEWLQTAIEQAARLSQDPKIQGQFWDTFWNNYQLVQERRESAIKGAVAGGGLTVSTEWIGQRINKTKDELEKIATELGIRHALNRMQEPRMASVTTTGGVSVQVPVPQQPLVTPRAPELPPVPGVEGANIVDQALSLGLERTAAALTGRPIPPLDLSVAQPVRPAWEPARTPRQAVAAEVMAEVPIAETPTAPQPAPIPPGTPAEPVSTPVAQPSPAEATAGPAAVPGVPGVSPGPEIIPAAPRPTPGPALPIPMSQRALGLRTSLDRMFQHIAPLFDVVENAEALPEAVIQDSRSRGLDPNKLDAVFHNGRIIFNASHFPIGNPALVYQKAVHEAAIHLGLRQTLGQDRFTRLVQDVWRGLSAMDRATIAARNRLSPDQRGQVGEEWLAYEAERVAVEGKSNRIWAPIAAAIRAAARRIGIPLKFSDVEIARLIAKGWRGAEQAAQAPPGAVAEPLTRASVDVVSENQVTGVADLRNLETEGSVATRFSVRDYPDWREDAMAQLTRDGRVDEATVQRWLDDLDEVATLTAALARREGLLEEFPIGRPARGLKTGPIQYNEPYIFSFDGSGICTLRLPSQEYLNAVTEELSRRGVASDMSPAEREIIFARLVVAGMPRMCTACYVETRRALRGKYAGLWARYLTGAPIEKEDLTDGMLNPKPEVVRARRRFRGKVPFEDIDQTVFIDAERWDAATADPNSHLNRFPDLYRLIHAQSISNANLVFERRSYTGQYRRLTEAQRGRQELQGGLRFYSISDFLFEHAIDILQAIADAASKAFPGHLYTKQPDTAALLAETNMKMNLSWIPMVTKEGKLKEWQGMSFPWDQAVKLKRQNPNIGITLLAFTDDQIRWGMENENVGQIIPYHRSGMYANQFDVYVKQQGWQNYETEQHYKVVNPEKYAQFEKEFRARYGTQYTPEWKIGWFLNGQAMSDYQIVERALEDADKYGIELPFQRFMRDSAGEPVAGAAKLLKDYARTDTPQLPLQPVFDRSTYSNLMNAWAKPKALYGGKKANQIKVSQRLVNVMANDLETYRQAVKENPEYEQALWESLIALQLEYAEDPFTALSSRKATTTILPKPGVVRASVSEGEETIAEPTAHASPTVTTPTGAALAPRAITRVPGHDEDYATRFSVTQPISIANADVNQALARANLPPLPETITKPDAELVAEVQRKMVSDIGWVDRIIERETKKPGQLSDEENLALNWWFLKLRTDFDREAAAVTESENAGREDEAAIHAANADFWAKPMQKLAEVLKRAGTETGRALRSRRLILGEDFTLQGLINEKRQAVGWRTLTDQEMRDLAKTAAEYKRLNDALTEENRRLLARDVDAEIAAAREELAQINPAVLDFAKEWIDSYKRKATNARDRFLVKWNRLHPETPMRASVAPGAPVLPDELLRELAIMGGAKLAANITDPTEWADAMVADTGEFIRPYLPAARAAAEAHLAAELAAGRAEAARRRAPRKVPGAPPAPTTPQQPTVDERMAVTKAKIAQVIEKRRTSAEPVKTVEDDLYYPVQKLVRELVEQDPLITRDELITQVHQILMETLPEISREETMDAISGRGRVRIPSQETVDRTIRDLKAQTRIASHILDVEARKPLPATGYQPDKPTDEQRRLMQRLTEAKRKFGEVVTDPAVQLASYLDSRKTWYRNRIADLRYEIAQRSLIVRSKMPGQTDAELEALKAEYDQVRQEHEAIFVKPDLTPEQRLVMAEAAAERIITKLKADLAEGRITANRNPNKLTSAKLEALRTEIIQLKAEQEWAQRHLNPPPDLKEPADIRRWFALDKSIRKIEQQLADKNPFSPGKRVRPVDTPTNQKMAARLEALKQERKEMRERLGPAKRSPLEQAIYHRMAQLRRQIKDYNKRIAERDFAPKPRKEPTDLSSDPEAIKLLAERDRVKQDFFNALEKDRWERMHLLQKIWTGIRQTRRALVNLKSSFDFSGLRQGLLAMASLVSRVPTSPIRMTKAIGTIFYQMFRAAWNPKAADKLMAVIKERPNAQYADRIAKIEYSDINGERFTRAEENMRSVLDEWAELPRWEKGKPLKSLVTFPVKQGSRAVAGSNRAFATFLNLTRATLFDELLAVNYPPGEQGPTENELRVIGNWVNVATGRGKMNPAFAKGAAEVIWAPKLLASRLQFLLGQPLWGGGDLRGSARARMIIAKEYARVIASGILLASVARLFDEKKEPSPLSSDYGKIVRGNTRIDLWGGLQQATVLLSRIAAGKTKTLKGRTIDLALANKSGQRGLVTVLTNFLRTKLRPDIGIAVDLATRSGYTEPTVAGVAKDLLVPLPFADIGALMKDRGIPEALVIEALNQFGAGVSVYEPEPKKLPPRERRVQ